MENNCKKLKRSRMDRKICGVCGGLSEYFNVDVTVIRVLWAVLSIANLGTGFIIYLIVAVLMPEED